jgi:uncharacterized protein YcbK (DUF882 family)
VLPKTTDTGVSRRHLLRFGLAAATLIAAKPVLAATAVAPEPRRLSFENLHTGEKLSAVYWDGGEYSWEGLRQINHILRDFRTDEVFPIDARLLEVLHRVDGKLGGGHVFQIISGYRSPKTNAMLHAADSEGVAKKSMHMMGQAIDIRVKDVDLAYVRQTAINLKTGGVGYYSKSQFVHLDLGKVRSW